MVSGLLPGLRYRGLWAAIGVGLVAAVVWLSLTPDPVPAPDVEGIDVNHFIAYFTLMMWWAQLVRGGGPRAGVAAGLVAMGVALELAQALTGYRTYDVRDMRDNAIGVGAAYLLAFTPLGRALQALERWGAAR